MTLQETIEKEYRKFGKKLSIYLKAELETALHKGGSKNVQEASLNFREIISTTQDGIRVQIEATDDYWYWIEHGRKPGKQPPADKLGKKWQSSQKIDPRKVIADIELKYKQKNGLSIQKRKGLTKPKKKLSFDAAARQLSFVIARSIGKKGFKARPFIDKALEAADLEGFLKGIAEIIGKDIIGELTLK